MKKEEKTELTKSRILETAIIEFGSNGYSGASINNICNTGISKGLIYHNFKSKDELYICCIRRTYDNLMEYLGAQNIGNDYNKYMKERLLFFQKNTNEARIFFESILQPPIHLKNEIQDIRKEFDEFNQTIYKSILDNIVLRENITENEAMQYFKLMQDMFHSYFCSPSQREEPLDNLIDAHEKKLTKILDFMIYGIAERR